MSRAGAKRSQAMAAASAGCLLSALAAWGGDACPPGGTMLGWEGFGEQYFVRYCNRCHDYDHYSTVFDLRHAILEQADAGNMPPSDPFPTLTDRHRLAEWISCGAPELSGGAPNRRGDANGDGSRDISDAIALLQYLFTAEAALPCLDAADMDGNGALELTDAVFWLSYLFRDGLRPPEPFQECGSRALLGCETYAGCS